jgi:hypothetical protein
MSAIVSNYPAGWPPEDEVFPVASLDLRVLPGEHPFAVSERQAAEANWKAEIAANPALYDNGMVFQHQLSLHDGAIDGQAYMAPFSTFMWWRKQAALEHGFHLYGWCIPVSSDGAIIAIRMGAWTVNAGMVYCAAGSLDGFDVVDGRCDIDGNMAREVREETGLDLSRARPDGGYFATHNNRRITVFRFFRFDRTADEMMAEIAAHMLVDEEKEIDGTVAIRSADPAAHRYHPAMLPVLQMFFGKPG